MKSYRPSVLTSAAATEDTMEKSAMERFFPAIQFCPCRYMSRILNASSSLASFSGSPSFPVSKTTN
jgi:hypothetical protein